MKGKKNYGIMTTINNRLKARATSVLVKVNIDIFH